jgi:serine phosphatase RsbU (regulator of sigma subunit)
LNFSFRAKLLSTMCGLVLLTGAVLLAVADRSGRANARTLVHALFHEVSAHAADESRDFILRAAPVAQSLEHLADHGLALDDPDKLAPQLLAFLQGNQGMTRVLYGDEKTGAHVAASRDRDGHLHIERTDPSSGKVRQSRYAVGDDGSWKTVSVDDNSTYDPRTRPFYVLAKEKGALAWTPPYMFFTEGVPGISCVIPVKTSGGSLRGVFDVEFDLVSLSEFVSELTFSQHSRVFLFTPDQTLLAHPSLRNLTATGLKGKGALLTLVDTGDPLVEAFRRHLEPDDLHTSDQAFHFFEFDHAGTGYLASTTVFSIGGGQSWVVGAIAPQSDFLAAVWRTRWLALAVAIGALAVAALLAAATARRISTPVQALIAFMQRVGAGDLEATADLRGGREFRDLSAALNRMIVDLRERLQLRHSLHIAREVQKSLLPAADPVSPRLDIAGRSQYCDDTGGDYYDFIDVAPISPTALLVAVGDVMGHGIPAALLMATVRAALRTSALHDHSLAELMTRTNQVLAADNRHNRFVTLSLMLIDANTRVIRWASAGHDPAIVYDPRTDSSRELEGGDVPLGVAMGVEYKDYTSDPLGPDSVVIIGTDGVWEMMNEQQKAYGKERMQRVVRDHHAKPAAGIAAALEADLTAFHGARTPADDVTFVILKFRP